MRNSFKLKILLFLLFVPYFGITQVKFYGLNVIGEVNYNPIVFSAWRDADWGSGNFKVNYGVNSYFSKKNQIFGIGVFYFNQYLDYGETGSFPYSCGRCYLEYVEFKSYKFSLLYHLKLKKLFSIDFSSDFCLLTYEKMVGTGENILPPYVSRYENKNLRTGAISFTTRFNKQFAIGKKNRLGVHFGITSPYLYLNKSQIYSKANLIGIMFGINYGLEFEDKK